MVSSTRCQWNPKIQQSKVKVALILCEKGGKTGTRRRPYGIHNESIKDFWYGHILTQVSAFVVA